jgi:hypothetical protein
MTTTTTNKKVRRPRIKTPDIDFPADLTREEILAGLVAVHVQNYRDFRAVAGGTGARQARARLNMTNQILAGLGASQEQIRLAK